MDIMIEVHRQLKSYVESRNNEYSISFTLKEAEELLKYINRLEVRNYKLEEKSNPVKPTHIESHTEHRELFISGTCGICGNTIYDSQMCCDYCGRKIDWSQEE